MYWVLLCFALLVFKQTLAALVHEVAVGSIAILDCPSNIDNDHRFQYWQLSDDQSIVGPGNNFDEHKYSYEVWSGRLIIRSVSSTEGGLYKCTSKNVRDANINVKSVELLVKKDWEESFEDDPQTNAYRTVIGILVFLIIALLGGFAFFFIRQRRSRNFLVMSREASPENPPTGAYNPTTTTIRPGSHYSNQHRDRSPRPSRVLDHATVETDIKTSFALPDYD